MQINNLDELGSNTRCDGWNEQIIFQRICDIDEFNNGFDKFESDEMSSPSKRIGIIDGSVNIIFFCKSESLLKQ